MQDNHRVHPSFVQTGLPWAVGAVALLIYAVTLNHWVTLQSLPFIAKVTGWDWTLPFQTPLYFVVTYPFRWLPASWQPTALNLLSALCSALSLALLVRSVCLLPHDRTHEQRQRERSEFSLLSIPAAWVPPVLAALVCGLELTFWEQSTAAGNETLDLLLFAYVIRCLLEFRINQKESWLMRMSFVYGIGVTNNFAMIGFFPFVLVAVFWIKGLRFFEARFFGRMLLFGLLGLSLYLLLPLVWALSDNPTVSFWQTLRAQLASQKALLLHGYIPRTRLLFLCLTSILPLLIIGIRWPASFGDTSAAGAFVANFMFRAVHAVLLVACIAVAFDLQFSPRAIGARLPYAPPFLSFYYLGALSVGYFSGYLLLVFGESRSKSRHRTSPLQLLLNRTVQAAVWAALIAVPIALAWRNWPDLRLTNGPYLRQLTQETSAHLPTAGGIVLSDDAYSLLLLSAGLSQSGTLDKYLMVHTRSLIGPEYHRDLHKRYPNRWPNFFTNQPPDEIIDDSSLLLLLSALSRTNEICYLHPSFGYYFESFYLEPHGMVYQLKSFPTNTVFPPPLSSTDLSENQSFWANLDPSLKFLAAQSKLDSRDARYLGAYYSRALNFWGVELQRNQRQKEAESFFQRALELNTNNVPALCNSDMNQSLLSGRAHTVETPKSIEERFGLYPWDRMLLDNGPFDQPELCARLGELFTRQGLYRQAAIQWDRAHALDPSNLIASLALAEVYLRANLPDNTLNQLARMRADQKGEPFPVDVELEMARLEATAQFTLGKTAEAEKILLDAFAKHPKSPAVLDSLLGIYARTDRFDLALKTAQQIIAADPERAQSYINEAQLFQQAKQSDKAIASLDRILQKYPNQPQVLLFKVFLLIGNKQFAQAKQEVDRLLTVDPENIEALRYKAVVAIESKSFQAALDPLSQVLKQQPADVNALRNRAIAFLQLGKLDDAESDYNALRRLGLRDYVYAAYYGLGEIAYKRHDLPTARKFYRLYLDYAPAQESPELKDEKRMVSDRLKELKEAMR